MGDMLLMCKNTHVYNIDTQEIINQSLLPGIMQRNACKESFEIWMETRYNSDTNNIARKLEARAFGANTRDRNSVDKVTGAFSLTDCYWIKDLADSSLFEERSPYSADFWGKYGENKLNYKGNSIPTLYVGGYLNKEWINNRVLAKYGAETLIELDCIALCKACNIPSENILPLIVNDKIVGVQVENITNTNVMLEQANQSGKLDIDDFDEYTIEKLFSLAGIQMIIIDAIVGNGDRHAGNFGWLRDSNTGKYICMAPLYDFDHALDSKAKSDRLITDMIEVAKTSRVYMAEAIKISKIAIQLNIHPIFTMRAKTILEELKR